MSDINKQDGFGFLGIPYQRRLITQLITDHKFATNIMGIVDPNYFTDLYLRIIASEIKNAFETDEVIPDIESLEFRLNGRKDNETTKLYIKASIAEIKDGNLNDSEYVQDMAMKFCKQQELKKSVHEIQEIIDKGDLDSYDECEEILKRALEVGSDKDSGIDVFFNIEAVLEDDFRKPIPTGIAGLDDKMGGGLSKGELGVILAPFGVGKAQPLHSKILTPNGWTTMGEIQVGDEVISRDGKATKVTGVFPQGVRPIYEVRFNDNTKTLCDAEHLWSVNTINQRNRKTKKNGVMVKLEPDNSFKTLKTIDMVDKVRVWGNKRLNYKIPNILPVNFNKNELIINPYLLGVILGDGCITEHNQPHITTKDVELIDEIEKYHNNINITEQTRMFEVYKNGKFENVERTLTKISLLGIKDDLSSLKLYGCNSETKFIPHNYLYSSVEDRVSLLQGLVDTDGYIDNHIIEICTISKMMSEQIKELVLSLGGTCNIGVKIGSYLKEGVKIRCKKAYRVYFSLPTQIKFNPCRLERKLNNLSKRSKYANNKFITSIEYSHEEEAQCIMVDNPEHLYITDDYIVTHNTTMVTKIANEAFNHGYNVLQIFFEDIPKVIQRKHLSCWTGIAQNDLPLKANRPIIDEVMKEKNDGKGYLELKKFPSDGTTIPMIKNYIRKLAAAGRKPDVILIDYIDCVSSTKHYDKGYEAEGPIMRQFESLLSEFDLVGWTAIQGNRCVSLDTIIEDSKRGKIEIRDVKLGDEILTHKGYKKVTHIFPIAKQPVYKIKLKSGKTIKVSKKHKFPTKDGEMLSIEDGLKVGNILLGKK